MAVELKRTDTGYHNRNPFYMMDIQLLQAE